MIGSLNLDKTNFDGISKDSDGNIILGYTELPNGMILNWGDVSTGTTVFTEPIGSDYHHVFTFKKPFTSWNYAICSLNSTVGWDKFRIISYTLTTIDLITSARFAAHRITFLAWGQ